MGKIFDRNDVVTNPVLKPPNMEIEAINISSTTEAKMVNVSTLFPPNVKDQYIHLLSKYINICAWYYDDLKAYYHSIIEHHIPLKEGVKPFWQNLIHINPLLLTPIKK